MPGFNIPRPGRQATKSYGSNTQEAGRMHRFAVSITADGAGISAGPTLGSDITFNVKTVTRPGVEYDEIIVHSGQNQIPLPGKDKFKPIEISFYEALSNDGSGFKDMLTDGLHRSLPSLNYAASYYWTGFLRANYKFNMKIFMLDGKGNKYLTYSLFGCHVSSLDPGDLSYADNEISTTTVTIKYDKYVVRGMSGSDIDTGQPDDSESTT
jgi:hypothetical protein